MSSKSATDLVNEAKQQIENLSPYQVKEELSKGNVTLIDIRESEELKQNGKISGSIHAPRGMLEFYADPSLPIYHKAEIERSNRIILVCATGGRSALSAISLRQMGFENVAHLDGGLKAWKDAGMPIFF